MHAGLSACCWDPVPCLQEGLVQQIAALLGEFSQRKHQEVAAAVAGLRSSLIVGGSAAAGHFDCLQQMSVATMEQLQVRNRSPLQGPALACSEGDCHTGAAAGEHRTGYHPLAMSDLPDRRLTNTGLLAGNSWTCLSLICSTERHAGTVLDNDASSMLRRIQCVGGRKDSRL